MSARSKCSIVGTMSRTASFCYGGRMVEGEPMGDAGAAIVRDDLEALEAEMRHRLDHVTRHFALGVRARDPASRAVSASRRSRGDPGRRR